jgi:uncharacterized protein with PhoU and TrkA domain
MEHIEQISWNGQVLAMIVRSEINPERTVFVTPEHFNLQLGFVVYAAGKEVPRHTHRVIERHIEGTSEILFIKKGRCLMDIYDNKQNLVTTRELKQGDVLLMIGGGHGFRMLEDTILVEIKQGPYTGIEEKERF